MRRLRLAPLALILATAALTVAAGAMLFSVFMLYDDEGYVLLSLKNFVEHGQLYREVYSQYGPFPYAWWQVLHLLGVPLTNNAGRVLTVLIWAAGAAGSGALVWRLTRHFAAALATLATTFVYLWIMASEPSHPGGLIVLLTALLAVAGGVWLDQDRTTHWAALAGAGAAALLLTKFNVGGFAALSAAALWILHHRDERLRRFGPFLLAAGAAALPWALMKALLATPWVQTYAAVFTLAVVPAVGAAAIGATARMAGREVRAALAGGAAVTLGVLGLVLARGTSLSELLEGMLLGPLRHPVNFSLRFLWPQGILVAAGISLGLFLAARWFHRRQPERVALGIALIRVAATVALAAQLLRFPAVSPDNLVLAWSAPLLWPFLWPLPGETPSRTRARTWLGLLFFGQWLHAYPVPGSQIAWGTFLALPLAAVGATEAIEWLGGRTSERLRRVAKPVLQLTLIAGAGLLGMRLAEIGMRYTKSRSLALPGAELVRLPDATTATYRLLSLNAAVHTDLLFSLPGMFSLNLWSGQPTPTLANATHWFSLLSATQQQAILASLAAHPRAGIIVQSGHLDFLRARGLTPHGPLVEAIMRDYEPAFTIDDFEFRVRRGRHIAPLQTAELFESAPPDTAGTLLRVTLLLPANATVATIELTGMDGDRGAAITLNNTNCRVEFTPLDSAGAARAAAAPRSYPFSKSGPTMLNLFFDRHGHHFLPDKTLIILRSPTGEELALVRLLP